MKSFYPPLWRKLLPPWGFEIDDAEEPLDAEIVSTIALVLGLGFAFGMFVWGLFLNFD